MRCLAATQISQIFLISALLMVALVGVIVFFVLVYQKKMIRQEVAMQRMETEHQKNLLSATIESQERERQRIAKDLHDEVGAMLSVIKMSIQRVERKVAGQEKAQASAAEAKEMVTETIDNVRRISKDLMPVALLKLGLPTALEDLFKKLESLEGVEATFELKGKPSSLPTATALGLYRVIQESLNNCLKHAEASVITCLLRFEPHRLYLSFEDNGKGFELEGLKKSKDSVKGLGVRNIESRVNSVGGKLTYISAPGKGTQIHIELEISKDLL